MSCEHGYVDTAVCRDCTEQRAERTADALERLCEVLDAGADSGAPESAAQPRHGTLNDVTEPELHRVSDELYVDLRRVRAVRHSTLSNSAVLVLDGGCELTAHGMSVSETVAALRTALDVAD